MKLEKRLVISFTIYRLVFLEAGKTFGNSFLLGPVSFLPFFFEIFLVVNTMLQSIAYCFYVLLFVLERF